MNYINYLDALLYKREQKQSKMHFLMFSIQSLSEQLLSCLKIGRDQSRVISYIKFKRITTQMLHSFKAIRQVALEKNIFKGFTIYGHSSHLGPVTWKKYKKGLGSIRGVFGPMSKISFTLLNYSFVIWDKKYRRYFVI